MSLRVVESPSIERYFDSTIKLSLHELIVITGVDCSLLIVAMKALDMPRFQLFRCNCSCHCEHICVRTITGQIVTLLNVFSILWVNSPIGAFLLLQKAIVYVFPGQGYVATIESLAMRGLSVAC